MLLVMLMTAPDIVLILILKTRFQILNPLLDDYLIGKNAMKAKPNKCYLLLSINQDKLADINCNAIHNTSYEKLLGITIDTNLKFAIYVNNLCKKASQKLNALTRIASLMDVEKRRSVIKSFTSSYFNYCPLVCMLIEYINDH